MSVEYIPKEILDKPLSCFKLSVRACNCFNCAGVFTLRDLVNKTEDEIMRYKNFGIKTLRETKKILSKKGLFLGGNFAESQSNNIIIKKELNYKNLLIPISELELSVRSSNCLRKMRVKTIGDLAKKTEMNLLSHRNFGKKSLVEVKELLHSLGFYLGMKYDINKIQDYNNKSFAPTQLNEPSSLPKCLSHIRENLLKANILKKRLKNNKMIEIIKHRFWTENRMTLGQLGEKLSLTRERIRQIEKRAKVYLYKSIDIKNKQFINEFINEIKLNGGIKILKDENIVTDSQEFKLFNMILSHIDRNIEFDFIAKVWLIHKKGSIYNKIDKLLIKEYKLGHIYTKEEIVIFANKCVDVLGLDINALDGIIELIIVHWFKPIQNNYAFKVVSVVEILSELIKEYFPEGIAIYKDIDSIVSLAQSKGYGGFVERKKRALVGLILRSEDLILWDWGVYIHKDNVKINQEVLEKVEEWIKGKFLDGFSPVSLWGAFSKFKKRCKENNIPNEHALYSCMKLKYTRKYSFLKDPYVYRLKEKERVDISKILEDFVQRVDSVVTVKEIMDNLGLKEFQITQHVLESDKVLQCEEGKYIHENKLNILKEDWNSIYEWVAKEIRVNSHISVKHAYEENIVTCKKCNIIDSRVLYSVLSKRLKKKLCFPRYPYVLEKDHGIISDGSFSFNDIVNDFFIKRNRVVYEKELYDYFVKERGYSTVILGNLFYLCNNIVQYAKGAYISLDTLYWDDQKSRLLDQIATIKFHDCCKAGHPFASIDSLLEDKLPKISDIVELSWQKKLLIDLLERIDKIKILGNMNSIYVVVPNEYNIETTEDLVCFVLKKEFSGAINKGQFLKRLEALRITKTLNENGKKYKIINEEIIAQD